MPLTRPRPATPVDWTYLGRIARKRRRVLVVEHDTPDSDPITLAQGRASRHIALDDDSHHLVVETTHGPAVVILHPGPTNNRHVYLL